MKKKVIFYHAFLYGNNYRNIMVDQFRLLISSKLLQVADKLYIGIADSPEKNPENGIEWVNSFWDSSVNKFHDKVEILVYPENNELIPTLKRIADYAKCNPDDYICFFHIKGILHNSIPLWDWRKYMEYFIIEKWKDCIEKLDNGYDACGVLWNRNTVYGDYPHFSGAFYWATAKYINTLDHSILDLKWRYAGEFWIGTNKEGKIFEFHNSRMNDIQCFHESRSHYSLPYPRCNYDPIAAQPKLKELNIEDGLFLTDKGCIHNYLEDYEKLFSKFRNKEINIFEVGYQYGGSCRLWEKYFLNAHILSIDITEARPFINDAKSLNIKTEINTGDRVKMEIKDVMKLDQEYFENFIPDIAIDDGSHKIEEQIYFVKLIYPILRRGGLLIIEDIQDLDNQRNIFQQLGWHFCIIDKREESGIYDDVLIIYEK